MKLKLLLAIILMWCGQGFATRSEQSKEYWLYYGFVAEIFDRQKDNSQNLLAHIEQQQKDLRELRELALRNRDLSQKERSQVIKDIQGALARLKDKSKVAQGKPSIVKKLF